VGAVADATSDDVPVDLRAAVERRVRGLAEPTRELLRLAAVLGTTFSLDQLATVAAQDILEVVERLRPAFDDGLLGDDGFAVAFRHDLVRDAVYDALPAAERTELHHEIGRRLSATDTPPSHVAEHLAIGAARGDVEAVRWLRKAGLDTASHDAATAVGYLERALTLSPTSDPKRPGLVTALANQLVLVGRYADAERHIRATLAQAADPTIEAMLSAGLGNVLAGLGRVDDARLEYLRAASVAGNPWVNLSTRAAAATMAAYRGNFDVAVTELTEIQVHAEQNHVVYAQAIAAAVLGAARAADGDLTGAVDLGRRSVVLSEETESFWASFLFPHLTLAPALLGSDRIAEARAGLRIGRVLAVQRNARTMLPAYDGLLAVCDYLEGRWDDAATVGVEAARLRRELGWTYICVPGASLAILVSTARGERSTVHGDNLADLAAETNANAPCCIEYADLAAAALSDHAQDSARLLSRAWESRRPFHLPGFGSAVGIQLVRLYLEIGDREEAVRIADELTALAARAPAIRSLAAAALRARGLVEELPDALLAASELLDDSPRTYERAAAIEDAGISIAGRDPARARQLIADALDGYDELGARQDMDRLIRRMRGIGINPRNRRRPPRPRFGWEALTPTETRVVTAVARGLTNGAIAANMYISRHTVESHIKHIFAKLGVRSRAEVAHQGALHGL
jgi:DNA-binding CsgD family transcriptional regulator/tetratricopeptide (TPR) repeat protein